MGCIQISSKFILLSFLVGYVILSKEALQLGQSGWWGGGDGEQERGVWHAGNRFNQDFSVREIHALVDQIYLGQCGDFALGQ